jgi:subtilisin family serine protease
VAWARQSHPESGRLDQESATEQWVSIGYVTERACRLTLWYKPEPLPNNTRPAQAQGENIKMSARSTRAAFSALAAVLAAFTIVGCSPGGSTPTDSHPASAGHTDQGTLSDGSGATADGTAPSAGEDDRAVTAPPIEAMPGELLVKFKSGTPSARIQAALPRSMAISAKAFSVVPGLRHVKLAPGVALDSALEEYRARPDVEYAEPNYIVRINAIPNEPRFVEQWGLNNTGQSGGFPNADIDAPEAWDLTQGDSSIVVAVIDTGVDYTHPDLAANIYSNPAECNANGIDDDSNGFVDDCYGIDTVNGDSDPADDNRHGTHVAGTIGAIGNNGIGVAGVAWNVKILPCKFIGTDGTGPTSAAIACLDYVAALAARGVNIVATNNSWGGGGFSQALADAIANQRQHGILFIAAAGNNGLNHDYFPRYPCQYDAPNIICVAATTEANWLAWYSDYGWHSVHVGAPGSRILSTLPGGAYGELDGTSMATPHVTGIAALLKAHDPTRDWRAVRNLILAGGKATSALLNKTITARQVSALGSLTCSNSIIRERLQPVRTEPMRHVGDPVLLRMLHINCAVPNGAPTVSISPSGETVLLHDDGVDGDTVANDGIYSATWTSYVAGSYTLSFEGSTASSATFDEHLRPGYPIQMRALDGIAFQGGPALHTLVGNIDMDPEPEILRSALTIGPLYAWNHDGTLVSGWPAPAPECCLVAGVVYPALGRFTGSSSLDVLANHTTLMGIVTGSGQPLQRWLHWPNSEFPPSTGDLDGDGLDEAIFAGDHSSFGYSMQAYRADSTAVPGWPITLATSSSSPVVRTPAVADLFGDGSPEIIYTDAQRVYAYHHDGSVVTGFPVDLSATAVRSFPVVGDVDSDGAPEIIVVSQAQGATHAIINILGNTGVIERTIVTSFEIADDVAPALADFDDDGIPEIVVQFDRLSSAGALAVWRGTGTPLSGWPVSIDDQSGNSAPVVGDVNGDGAPDIVLMTRVYNTPYGYGDVRAYDHLGQTLAGFPKRLPSDMGAAPAIADLDLDGRNDIIVSGSHIGPYLGHYDTIWAFDLEGPTGNAAIEWGQFMNDEKHSGFYKTGKNLATAAYVATQIRGNGTITSSPAGIACGADCIELYPKGTRVTLTASGGTFGSWHGACAGQGNPCVVSIQDYTPALAHFGEVTLSVNVSGDGTITSAPAGITCSGTCSSSFGAGSTITLTATAQVNAYFSGWSGACSGRALSCSVTMDAAKSVTASFLPQPILSVSSIGTGSGTITSSLPGIDCGSDCSQGYDPGSMVTLTATPAPGSTFDGWVNSCTTAATPCTMTMIESRHVTARFTSQQTVLRELIVTKQGTGAGSVVSNVPGIDCGPDCSERFDQDLTIVLTAVPDEGSEFVGWSGACNGSGPECTLQVTGQETTTAVFDRVRSAPATFPLNVSKSGSGGGTVTSAPAGIDCGADCSQTYDQDVIVTLTAAANERSVFGGWSGACSGEALTCSVTMNAARSVTAIFSSRPMPLLSVSSIGSGSGTIASSPPGINCGSDCSEGYEPGTQVTLTATPAPGSIFLGWANACTPTRTSCSIAMLESRQVTAVFSRETSRELVVTKAGTGTGSIVSSAPGINCGADCTESYSQDVIVVLTAIPDVGSAFTGWSGACSGSAPACTLQVNEQKRLPPPTTPTFVLSVSKSGSGGGAVTSQPAGIDCNGDCSESYEQDAVVTLTATSYPGSVFSGWSGACSGTMTMCSVTMSAAKSVTADFTLKPVLTVALSGSGTGTVTSGDGGVACGNDCAENYMPSTVITLNATAAQGSVFDGWTGACAGQSTVCTVTMDADKSIGASFRLAPAPPSDSGGGQGGSKGGGGQFDWTLLALCATVLLLRQRRTRLARETSNGPSQETSSRCCHSGAGTGSRIRPATLPAARDHSHPTSA